MEKSILNILEKFGYQYDNGIVTPTSKTDTIDELSLNYELDEIVLEDEDFRFSYELIDDNGVLKLNKNEL